MGYIIAANLLFQTIGESVPGNHVPFTMGPKSKLVITIKANAETRKIITNLFLDILINLNLSYLKSTLKFKVKEEFFTSKVFLEKTTGLSTANARRTSYSYKLGRLKKG